MGVERVRKAHASGPEGRGFLWRMNVRDESRTYRGGSGQRMLGEMPDCG